MQSHFPLTFWLHTDTNGLFTGSSTPVLCENCDYISQVDVEIVWASFAQHGCVYSAYV